jgi:hypothetical protein
MLYWTAKAVELGDLVIRHPAAKDLLKWDFDGLKYEVDFEAIAQHYGYPTRMLDLTRSRNIAMFFATHHIHEDSRPEPALGCRAVLYTIDLKQFIENRANTDGDFAPIGLCPLPRPAAQSAFGVKLEQSEDFDLLPDVKKETITVTPELAGHYAGLFDDGRKLFPSDPFEDQIRTLRGNGKVSIGAIRAAVDEGRIPPYPGGLKGIEKCLTDRGYRVDPEDPRIPSPEILEAASGQWLRRRAGYIDRIRWRGVADAV